MFALLLCACSDSALPPAEAGATATVSLATTRRDDGAVAVVLAGPGFGAVQPASSAYQVYWRLVSNTELRVVVVGNIAAGPLFTVSLAAGELGGYSGQVAEAASRSDQPVTLQGYQVTLSAAPIR